MFVGMLSDAYLHEGYIILAIDYFPVHINVSYITNNNKLYCRINMMFT